MYLIRQGSRVSISTPAKLNLFLELHQRRNDGYHELETLMVPVDVYDSISVCPRDDGNLQLQCAWVPGLDANKCGTLPAPQDNVVHQALLLLREAAGLDIGADVQLSKRIPTQAGLGGGSSDAAGALVAANIAWGLHWPTSRLAEIAAQVGSDVPFFLFNSLALCTGRGEVVEPMRSNCRLSFVIVKPDFGLATSDVFRRTTVPESPKDVKPLIEAIASMNVSNIAKRLFNRLQTAASKLTPWIEYVARRMDEVSVCGHQMSGSGTSYFALCRNNRHARQVASGLRATRLGRVFVATALGPNLTR